MTPGQILAAILLAMAISAAGTWQVQDWRMGERLAEQGAAHQKALDTITGEAWRQQIAEQDKRLATEHLLAAQDQQHLLLIGWPGLVVAYDIY
ncbi:hypothetical protein AZH11_27450 [Pseudomonas simiae]|nr:hypothetical protein AZH11_27450 [Pseudomonas simiae]